MSSLVLFGLPSNHKSIGWEDLYIQSYLYSANCKGMKLFAKYCDSSKKKMSATKSLRLIQHVLLIRILCWIRSSSIHTREKVWHSKIVGIFTSMTLISLFFWLREKFDSGGFCLKFDGWHCRWEMHVCYQHSHFVCLYVYVQMKDVNMKDTYVKELHRHDHV